jgi:hypothetical protein
MQSMTKTRRQIYKQRLLRSMHAVAKQSVIALEEKIPYKSTFAFQHDALKGF